MTYDNSPMRFAQFGWANSGMLLNREIRTPAQLKADGFSQVEVKEHQRDVAEYFELSKKIAEAEDRKDYAFLVEHEPEAAELEFKILYRGKNPKEIPIEALESMQTLEFRKRSPATGVRQFCLNCMCGDRNEVRLCEATFCPLWPFRLGANPFFNKALPPVDDIELEDDEKVEIDEGDDGEDHAD
jgi:hypothetical protein